MSTFEGAILGIDHGEKFIGLAISYNGELAKPHAVIERKSKAKDFAKINEIISRENIAAIVLGLPPKPPDFVGHAQADTVRNWAAKLYDVVDVPIYLWDEGTSSMVAESRLDELRKPNPDRIDAHAAAVILGECLDALRNGHPLPEPFTPSD